MRSLAAIGAILLMVGFLLFATAGADAKQIAQYGEKPERITLKSLIDRGPNGPKNVIITDYVACENYVLETLERKARTGHPHESRKVRAYVPIVPAVGDSLGVVDLRPRRVQVVIECENFKDETDIFRRCAGPELQGLVMGRVSDIHLNVVREAIRRAYPDTVQEECLIVTEGEQVTTLGPPSLVRRIGEWVMYAGCIFLGLAAICWMERTGRAVYYSANKPKDAAPKDTPPPTPDTPPASNP
jgi:hypothetical protein